MATIATKSIVLCSPAFLAHLALYDTCYLTFRVLTLEFPLVRSSVQALSPSLAFCMRGPSAEPDTA